MRGYVTDVAYLRRFQRELAPAWLDCIAILCGTTPPDRAGGFSWCDLGCGPGLTAIALAATHPEGRFTGVDLMPAHINQARRLAADAGVDSVAFHCADFASLDLGAARFDYITAHGVYAWIDDASRAALRTLIDRHLAPSGLVYLSYNAMPGWAADVPFQRLVYQLASDQPGDSIERFTAAAALVRNIVAAGAPSLAASPMAGELGDLLEHHPAAYLAHEYMTAHWRPLFVTEARQDMAAIGLTPVGSATFTDNFDSFALRRVEREALAPIADADSREQARDYLMHQRFRRDVYARNAPPLDDDERRERLFAMRYALARPAELIEFTTRTPAGQLNFDTEAARAIVAGLREGPRRLADISTDISQETLLADVLALCCAGAVRPVALTDISVEHPNRAILSRFGGPEQIDFLALSCGTAVAVEPATMACMCGAAAAGDADPWLAYLATHTAVLP